jgi:hypothetical protein
VSVGVGCARRVRAGGGVFPGLGVDLWVTDLALVHRVRSLTECYPDPDPESARAGGFAGASMPSSLRSDPSAMRCGRADIKGRPASAISATALRLIV